MYDTLERQVLPLFYRDRGAFIDIMRHAIALNGSFFTAQRMLREYVIKAYDLELPAGLEQWPAESHPAALSANSIPSH
jgi:hypothetical protein